MANTEQTKENTLKGVLAMIAMHALITGRQGAAGSHPDTIADDAFMVADSMIAEATRRGIDLSDKL